MLLPLSESRSHTLTLAGGAREVVSCPAAPPTRAGKSQGNYAIRYGNDVIFITLTHTYKGSKEKSKLQNTDNHYAKNVAC